MTIEHAEYNLHEDAQDYNDDGQSESAHDIVNRGSMPD